MSRTKQSVPQYTKRIPLLLKDKLDKLDYQRKENLVIILDLVYSRNFYKTDKSFKEYHYSEISKKSFTDLLGRSEYVVQDINFLVENDLLIRNDWYNYDEGISKSYKIPSEYLSPLVDIVITSPRINSRIKEQLQLSKERKVKNLQFQKSHYNKNFRIKHKDATACIQRRLRDEIKNLFIKNQFRVSDEQIEGLVTSTGKKHLGLKEALKERGLYGQYINIIHRHLIYQRQVDKINDKNFFFKRNTTNGRLDTNLTSLPRFLRQFIVSDGKLYSIDLKSSQPFFLYTVMKNEPSVDKLELQKYKELVVSGDTQGIYEFLQSEWNKTHKTPASRDKMKLMICFIFFGEQHKSRLIKQFFGSFFPTILNFIEKTKAVSYKDTSKMLQTLEADTILDTILKRLEGLGIVPYTIHDSFVCNEKEVLTITDTINQVMIERFGDTPNLHINPIEVDSEEESVAIIADEFDMDELIDAINEAELTQIITNELTQTL